MDINNNTYLCEFNYTVSTLGLTTDFNTYNYGENIVLEFNQPNITINAFLNDILIIRYQVKILVGLCCL